MEIINNLFQNGYKEPPLQKNHPPLAGSIAWERSLFNRMKHTIIRFQNADDMLISEQGKQVCLLSVLQDINYIFYLLHDKAIL